MSAGPFTLRQAHALLGGRAEQVTSDRPSGRAVAALPPPVLTVELARAFVARRHSVREDCIHLSPRGRRGSRAISRARALLARVLRDVLGLSWADVAREVGLSDHSSAIHAAQKAEGYDACLADMRQAFRLPDSWEG